MALYAVLRELTNFGVSRAASVSTRIGPNQWLVLTEPVETSVESDIDWDRMINDLFAGDLAHVVEAQ